LCQLLTPCKLAETNQQLEQRPDDEALLGLKAELEVAVEAYGDMIKEELEKLEKAAPAPALTPAPPSEAPKWDVSKHPAFQNQPQPSTPVEAPAHVFKVNEKVQARWKKSYVPGRIVSILGSSKDPTFYVSYDGYTETASLKTVDLKPLNTPGNPATAQKRKADDTPAYPAASTPYLSAEASIDPALAEKAKREPSKVSDGPTRPAKIPKKTKSSKKLEDGKMKWQEFSKGKVGKQVKKKESMFKTGEGFNARVGFTNSGHEMRKDAPRTRHVYKPEEGEEY
jgi:survival-of-motor-neuron-related-splicing factor 30